ncbi:hypothetical protein PGTUg99_001845 [Puccinia graminis f. sp. tritici]|uniref:Uncharacterized protein n=1 Tax=Puccinia graminis f. sp. tritici TaxID=56615 RepID=A0A5B0ND01_PUCGR|nr:hypothetical protein PGTUg99_001845 [Puccinia graminis f. sp. tritici]
MPRDNLHGFVVTLCSSGKSVMPLGCNDITHGRGMLIPARLSAFVNIVEDWSEPQLCNHILYHFLFRVNAPFDTSNLAPPSSTSTLDHLDPVFGFKRSAAP